MIYDLGDDRPEFRGEFYVADNATLIGKVLLEHEASVWFGCVLRGDNELITLGAGSNVQDGSVLHTDPGIPLTLERRVSVGHMAMLHGCTVGEESLIGIKAVVLNRAKIGRHCIIGAGALIPEGREIPERSLVVGMPGRVIRQVSDEEVAMVSRIADIYIERARRYRAELKPHQRFPTD